MGISLDHIKELREKTGAGMSDVRRALEEHGGDRERALQAIQRKLGSAGAKKASRETNAGLVESYIHSNGRVGAMVELLCETDFVARNPVFKELAHDLAMHITAMSPLYLSLDAVPKEMWQTEQDRFQEEVRAMGKPERIAKEIIDGKLKAYFGSVSLLEQPFIKDQNKTIGVMVNEAIGKFGENIKIGRFSRFEV